LGSPLGIETTSTAAPVGVISTGEMAWEVRLELKLIIQDICGQLFHGEMAWEVRLELKQPPMIVVSVGFEGVKWLGKSAWN